eukprot:snap_masked-scaffold_39-processed-gene-2.21-mRNA-1 protein AED:0.40 eAED:0.40 QI:0/0/0/0.5/1/1/2/0/379
MSLETADSTTPMLSSQTQNDASSYSSAASSISQINNSHRTQPSPNTLSFWNQLVSRIHLHQRANSLTSDNSSIYQDAIEPETTDEAVSAVGSSASNEDNPSHDGTMEANYFLCGFVYTFFEVIVSSALLYFNPGDFCSVAPLIAYKFLQVFDESEPRDRSNTSSQSSYNALAASETSSLRFEHRVSRVQDNYTRKIYHFLGNFNKVWLIVGAFWLAQSKSECLQTAPIIYRLDVFIVVSNFFVAFLPFVLMLLLFPIICLCLPCLLRGLHRLSRRNKPKGAKEEDLSRLPLITFKQGVLSSKLFNSLLNEKEEDLEIGLSSKQEEIEEVCAICLNPYKEEEQLRLLYCEHHFHKDCSDEWLLINATCPICRKSILKNGE